MTHTPPEIWKDVNQPRTVKYDVYSFAVLLWELLAEERPFKNGTLHSYLLSCFFFAVTQVCLLIVCYVWLRSVKRHT